MSRIFKFDSGGKSPRTFQYLGQEYDQDAVLREYHRRKDDWIRQNRYNRRQAEMFNRGFRTIANLLGSSKVSREDDGSWSNTEGVSSTGEMDTNIFGGIKKSENNEINLATALLDDIMKTMPAYTKPSTEKKKDTRSQYSLDLKDAVSRKYMPGGFDKNTWERYDPLDDQTKKRGNAVRQRKIADVLGDIINQINSQDFDTKYTLPQTITDKNKWISNLRLAQQKLADGTLTDEDYTTLAQTGFSGLDELLGISTEPAKPTNQGTNGISDIVRESLNPYVDKVTFKDNNGETHTIYTQTGSNTPLENGWVYPNAGPWDKRSNLYLKDGVLYDETSTDPQYQDALRWRYPYSNLPTGQYGYGTLRAGDKYTKVSDLSGYFEGFPQGRFLMLQSEDGRNRQYVYKIGDQYYEVNPDSISQNQFDNTYTGQYLENNQPKQFRFGKFSTSPSVSGLSMLHFDPNDSETYSEQNLQLLFPLLSQALTSTDTNERKYALDILSKLRDNKDTYLRKWGEDFISYRNGKWFVNNREIDATTGISEELETELSETLRWLRMKPTPEFINALKLYKETYGSNPLSSQQLIAFYNSQRALQNVQSAQVGAKIPEPKKTVLTKSEKAERNKIVNSYTNPANASISDLTSGRDDAFNMTWEDKTRLVTAMTDLIGVGLGMVPGANLIATATGIGSSIGQAAADYSDERVSGWDATTNLLANLGMDAISIVPVAKSLKGIKAAKSLVKYIPMIGTAVAASNSIENKNEIIETLRKIKDGEISSLTKADFRNLSTVASTIFGVKRLAKYGDSKKLFGQTSTNRSTVEYVNKKTGERGSIEIDNSKIQGDGRKGNIANAKAAVLKEVNKNIKAEVDKLKTDDIDVNTNVFGYLKSSTIKGDVNTSQNWRRLWQKYQETKGLRGSDLWIANKLNLIDRLPTSRRLPITTDSDELASIRKFGYKNGGILKFDSGGPIMSRPQTFRRSEPQTYESAKNPGNWGNYFYNDKAINQGLQDGWFNDLTADQLNELFRLKNNIGTISQQSDGTYQYTAGEGFNPTIFNTKYNQYLGRLNQEVYGYDESKIGQVGPSTWNRVQALDLLKNQSIKTKSGILKWDPIKNMFITEPLPTTTPGLAAPNNTEGAVSVSSHTGNTGKIGRRAGQFLPEDAIALSRMLGTIRTNNWANRRIQSAIKPTLIDTYENYIPQREDYLVRTSAYNQAGELGRQANRIAAGTSDSTLGAAAKLEASRQARQIQLQADQINSQRIFQTGEQGRAESNAAKARRVEVANRNKATMNQIALAKAQMDAQTKLGNWMQAIQPWLAGIENRIRTNRAMQRQLDNEAASLASYEKYSKDRQKYYNDYLAGYKTWRGTDATKTETQYREQFPSMYESLQNNLQNLDFQARRDALDNQKVSNTLGHWMYRPLPYGTLYAKSGSKLTAQERMVIDRAKDFNRALREQQKNFLREMQSVRKEYGSMIRQLSAFTANLIKSGMSWK